MVYGNIILNEKYIFNTEDIFYNKDKFDSGEINICFITGQSGSGKTTMAKNMGTENVYNLDDVLDNKSRFSMDELKEYGDLIYSFFNGIGKKYYIDREDIPKEFDSCQKYMQQLIYTFVAYSMLYAKYHQKDKFVVEGVWLYCIPPDCFGECKNCAVCIKGTSGLVSMIRSFKRNNKGKTLKDKFENIVKGWKDYILFFLDEKYIKKYVDYFSKLESNN